MPSDARSASRRLLRAARPLSPTTPPYYMHIPRAGRERFGAGWYWTPAGAQAPEYLGYNCHEAEYVLRRAAELAAGADDDEPGQVVALPGALHARAAAAAGGLAGLAHLTLQAGVVA